MGLEKGEAPAARRHRLLLEVAEAANSHLDLDGVLDALATGLRPLVHVDGFGLATMLGREHILLYKRETGAGGGTLMPH